MEGLTPRENELALLVAQASCNRSIARMLQISETTVESHLRRIYRKLDLQRYELPRVALAVEASRLRNAEARIAVREAKQACSLASFAVAVD
jgi:DNA-binding NarL/FixJ family response regulator